MSQAVGSVDRQPGLAALRPASERAPHTRGGERDHGLTDAEENTAMLCARASALQVVCQCCSDFVGQRQEQ